MLATKIICPHCSTHLKTSKPLIVGHRVLCSHCGRSFPVRLDVVNGVEGVQPCPAPDARTRTPQPPTLPPASLRQHDAHVQMRPDVELASAPVPKRQALWIGLIFGGLLFLMGATLTLVLYFATRKGPEDNRVEASTAMPSEPNAPLVDPPSDNQTVLTPNRLEAPPRRIGNDPPLPRDPPLPQPSSEPEQTAWLPPEEQAKVNKAIEEGVTYLKKAQGNDGSWGGRVGLAALPGLTLLECGVPADDLRIQKALDHVRRAIPHLNQTYDLALAILFLDRLGDPSDEKLIRTCALRLVAGQTRAGGWTYGCRILTPDQESDLLTVMEQTHPKNSLDLFADGSNGSTPPGFITQRSGTPFDKTLGNSSADGIKPFEKRPADPQAYEKALNRLPADLRSLPALQPAEKAHKLPPRDVSDNSNTQFAILGLSAAQRHNLPLDRSLALIVQRFRKSQLPNGRWNYPYSSPPHANQQFSPAMTGSGLLGLAVGLGLAADHAQPRAKGGRIEDAAIEKGFTFLAQSIGKPLGAKKPRARNRTAINLYFLWTVERCGVLYHRREIGGKDWYQWGAELLLDHQNKDGAWNSGGYYTTPNVTPITDTCFALLFLKRANLAKDLTKKLEFFMEGKKLQGP